ncbi:MAG TPA: hypothetical protein VMR33_12875 [Candidatus Baltobacteraceae bacterium]|jgi:hypothetical protein|nr:hypothetical protein [Candidatus Baltobacteraceae bacterium]
MRVLTSVICLAVSIGAISRAANAEPPVGSGDPAADVAPSGAISGETGGAFVVGLSPFLSPTVKDTVFRGLVRLIVEDLPLNTSVEVYDAFNLTSITRLRIPNAKVFNSPKTRANQFSSSIGAIKQFLARDNARPGGPETVLDGAIRLPQFCDFLAQNRPARDRNKNLPLLLIGSPLYQDSREPSFSMVEGYFPSDGHLHASREESVFGFTPGEGSSQGLLVYWAYFGDPWVSDLHREKVTRFWALYIERRDGRLASFSADLDTAMGAFSSEAPGRSAASNGWVADPHQTRLEMVRATRGVNLVDWLTGDALPETSPPPPSRLVGPLKIGIRWKENIDLDLYAAPRRDGETLFFQHPRSPEGFYLKDHRSSPGREYEIIEFESPVDVRDVRAFVNFYGGACPGGPRGEVRIKFLNHIYNGTFAIASSEGNQGRAGPSQAAFWTQISIQQILRINEAVRQDASASR